MRLLLPLLLLFAALPAHAQLNNWDPSWYVTDSTLVFHDDLDYYLNAYSKNEIKEMRKEVNIWRMNFDKLMLGHAMQVSAVVISQLDTQMPHVFAWLLDSLPM